MKVHSGRWFIVTLIVLFTVVMVACTRPARPGDETPTPTVATSGDGTVSGVVTATLAADTTSGGDTTGGDAAAGDTSTTTPPQPVDATPEPTSDASTGDTSGDDTGAATPDAGVATPDTGEATTEDAPTPEPGITATPVVTTTDDAVTSDTTTEDTTAGDAAATTATGTPPTTEVNHTVQLGESLYRIGLQYGYSWTVLAQYNGITNPNYVTPGQVIKIPAAGTPPPTIPPGEQLYTVKRGDTLGMIAAAYGVSWVQIAEANGVVNPNLIFPGQVLKIPSNTPGPAPQFSHVVKQGETLFLISLHYGVLWTQIAEANSITAPYVIFPGQTLIIPGGG